jgi:alpha-beta hydrolase superfamily lysophospholipase
MLTNTYGVDDLVAGIKEIQKHFKMTDGFDLFYRYWKPVGDAKKSVVCIHGMGAHSQYFRFIGPDLAADGNEVYALDLRGFGNSKEQDLPRGDTSNFKRHLQDVDEAVNSIRKKHPKNKVFMFGHSLGTVYTLWYAANYPDSLDGVTLAAPTIKGGFWFIPRTDLIKIPFMLLFAPKTVYDSYKTLTQEAKETEEWKIILQDTLDTGKYSWRWLGGVKRDLFDKALQNAARIEKPALIIQGEKDTTCLPHGAKQLYESLATKDKVLKTFPDADHFFYHALFLKITAKHDPAKRTQVTSVVKDWLNTH